MNAPVGPLDGATRPRPDGWLATPLCTDKHQAQQQAQALLREHHNHQRPGPVTCLTARYRSHTFALGHPPKRLLKRHAAQDAYLSEVLAYQLAGPEVLPTLYDACDDSLSLIVDYLDTPADLRAPGVFDELITAVATLHTAPARWERDTREVTAQWQIGAALTARTPGWITHPDAWRGLLRLTAAAHGPHHVPLGHLDLKPEHTRRHRDGRLAIIDTETLRPDLTAMPDLITLAWLARQLALPHTGRDIRHTYLKQVNTLGADWSDTTLTAALRAFAAATGLHRLHDAAT